MFWSEEIRKMSKINFFLFQTLGGHGLQGMGGAGPANAQQNGQNGAPIAQNREEKFLSQVFAWFAVLFVFWILFAWTLDVYKRWSCGLILI